MFSRRSSPREVQDWMKSRGILILDSVAGKAGRSSQHVDRRTTGRAGKL